MNDPDLGTREALRLIGPDPANWVPDREGVDHNVMIVGGGQTGCAFAFALRRAGVGKVSVIDAAPDAKRTGIWENGARMNVLRTPKTLTGPEYGIAALSFQAWYEARQGAEAYQAFERIPKQDWVDYLAWYREFLGIAVRYGTRLLRIEPVKGHFRLHLNSGIETCRKIIIATGFEGSGGLAVPDFLVGLPRSLFAHTGDDVDFAALKGKDVAVIGGAASAFDAAAVALENGAKSVHLFARRATLAATPVNRSRGYPGAYDNYYTLPDAVRWHQAIRYRRAGSTAPQDAIERVLRHDNFYLHLAAPWVSARAEAGGIIAEAGDAAGCLADGALTYRFDFAIAGTGYVADPNLRPEFADFARHILLWRDRYTPPADEEDPFLGAHPYLGPGNEFMEKTQGAAPYLGDIHCFNPAGFVSFGVPIGDVPSMKRGHPTVTAQISRDLFLADFDDHQRRMTGKVPADFGPELYQKVVWKRR
ncbi:MAG TPA: NAD(P)-binding domain-containing protein [Stellaceae bacterium]|nr:NAD(P)-binding domain-containing protein [Stellaceae bacterium]